MPDSKATMKLPEQTIRETKELTIDAIERLTAKMISGFSTSPTDKMSIDLIKEGLKRIHSRRPYGKDVAIFLGRIDSDVIPTRLRGYNGHSRKVALLELEMRVKPREI